MPEPGKAWQKWRAVEPVVERPSRLLEPTEPWNQ